MSRKYTPATFQPTVRPDWGGVLSYIPKDEKASILECIIKYPSLDCNSKFWLETIKPDLDLQYETFKQQCESKSRGVRNRWGKTSITPVKDENNKSNTDVIVPEGIGIGIGIREDEEEGKKETEYAFEGKIIKLNQKDFNNWQLAYPDLNLRAECLQRDKWLQGQPLEEQKKWFITTSAYFIKQNEKRKRQNAELNEKYETEEECWF
jgi:hypothetical protein